MKKQDFVTGVIFHEIGSPCVVRKEDGLWYKTSPVVLYHPRLKLLVTENTLYNIVPERTKDVCQL